MDASPPQRALWLWQVLLLQPRAHFGDLSLLCGDDLTCELVIVVGLTEVEHDLRHCDRALMMRDHAEHEGGVRIGMRNALHHRSMHPVHGGTIGLDRRLRRARRL